MINSTASLIKGNERKCVFFTAKKVGLSLSHDLQRTLTQWNMKRPRNGRQSTSACKSNETVSVDLVSLLVTANPSLSPLRFELATSLHRLSDRHVLTTFLLSSSYRRIARETLNVTSSLGTRRLSLASVPRRTSRLFADERLTPRAVLVIPFPVEAPVDLPAVLITQMIVRLVHVKVGVFHWASISPRIAAILDKLQTNPSTSDAEEPRHDILFCL